jgi:DNA-binding transcriptional LysR family regulator
MLTDLRLLQTFIQAARLSSFSAAARALRISPAAVSQNMKSLEDQIGTRLFTRTTRQVRLTPEGQRFLARCGPALGALEDAVRSAADEAERIEGVIRLTSTTAFGRSHVLPLIANFMAEHPQVRIEVELSDRFVDLVAEEFDFAIRAGNLPASEYVARLLLPVTPTVCAAPAYFAKYGKPQRIEDLARHRCIGMLSNPSQRVFAWEFKRGRQLVRHDVEPVLIVNDPEAAAVAAAAGIGLAQLGTNLCTPRLARGELAVALEAYEVQSRGIYAVYPTKRYTPARTKHLINFLAQSLAQTRRIRTRARQDG